MTGNWQKEAARMSWFPDELEEYSFGAFKYARVWSVLRVDKVLRWQEKPCDTAGGDGNKKEKRASLA